MEEDLVFGGLAPMVIMVPFLFGEGVGEIHFPFAGTFPGYPDGGGQLLMLDNMLVQSHILDFHIQV